MNRFSIYLKSHRIKISYITCRKILFNIGNIKIYTVQCGLITLNLLLTNTILSAIYIAPLQYYLQYKYI